METNFCAGVFFEGEASLFFFCTGAFKRPCSFHRGGS